MNTSTSRRFGVPFAAAVLGVLSGALLFGSGLALAQEAPESGVGVAEALAGPNTVNSAAIVNGSVTGTDIANGTIGRGDIKPTVTPMWAHVDAGPTTVAVVDGKGVTTVNRQGTGIYRVIFSRSVLDCALVATRSDNDDGISSAGQISVELENVNTLPNNAWVRTFAANGGPADTEEDEGFSIVAFCG
ncbi:MAG: hypothetical protein JNK12_06885 [Acidimicrobiales bacterium]|nr:hypothetical protein [Acidimicrobiales bacterium]